MHTFPAKNLIVRVAHKALCQSGLSRPIGTHDSMHLQSTDHAAQSAASSSSSSGQLTLTSPGLTVKLTPCKICRSGLPLRLLLESDDTFASSPRTSSKAPAEQTMCRLQRCFPFSHKD